MNDLFDEFVKKLSEKIKGELPGFSAQKLMDPLRKGSPTDSDCFWKGILPKKSAVLILLYPEGKKNRNDGMMEEWNVVQPPNIPTFHYSIELRTALILRPENEVGNHAGQISFPGGGIHESDSDLSETALRETEEEIGVDRKSVSIVGPLTPLYIPVSNFVVHPFVGVCNAAPEFKIHPPEVKELLEVEVNDLMSERNKKSVERFIKMKNVKMQVPCYEINGKIIWGATAMIISELSEIIKRMK